MRITIEIDEKGKAIVNQADQKNILESDLGAVIDSGGPGIQSQTGSNGTDYNFGNGSLTTPNAINAGEVPDELFDLMAGYSNKKEGNGESIDSGAAPGNY